MVGRARSELATPATTAVPLPVWPISSPSGSAMTSAMTSAITEYRRCSKRRVGMPSGAAPVLGCGQPVEDVADHDGCTALRHGVSMRVTSTITVSKTSASATQSTMPMMIGGK